MPHEVVKHRTLDCDRRCPEIRNVEEPQQQSEKPELHGDPQTANAVERDPPVHQATHALECVKSAGAGSTALFDTVFLPSLLQLVECLRPVVSKEP
jgi:hypothetical protein